MRRLLLALLLCLLLPNAALAARLTNGTSDYLSSALSLTLSGSSKLTVSFWLWWDSFTTNDDFAMDYRSGSNKGAFLIDPNSSGAPGKIQTELFDLAPTVEEITTHDQPSSGAWHHYVYAFDRSGTGADQITGAWIDGVAVTSQAFSNADVQTAFGNFPLFLMNDNAGAGLFGAGRIAEVALYSGYAFVQADVDALYNGGAGKDARSVQTPTYYWQLCAKSSPELASVGGINMTVSGATSTTHPISGAGICDAPTGWWTLDEHPASNGTTLADSGYGANAGTLTTDNGANDKSVAGKIATAIGLDGTGDYINIANQAAFNFNQQSFTVTAWVKNVTGVGVVASKGGTTDTGGWMFVISNNGLELAIRDASGNDNVDVNLTGTFNFNDGNWHHVAAVVAFDTVTAGNNSAVLYIDGAVPGQTNSGSGGVPTLNTKTLKWGARENNAGTIQTYLPGQLDDVRIYDYGLSAGQIAALCGCAGLLRNQGDLTGLGTGGKFHKDPLQYRSLRRGTDYDLPDLVPLVR